MVYIGFRGGYTYTYSYLVYKPAEKRIHTSYLLLYNRIFFAKSRSNLLYGSNDALRIWHLFAKRVEINTSYINVCIYISHSVAGHLKNRQKIFLAMFAKSENSFCTIYSIETLCKRYRNAQKFFGKNSLEKITPKFVYASHTNFWGKIA